jgi:hypothetical protein
VKESKVGLMTDAELKRSGLAITMYSNVVEAIIVKEI